VDGKTVYHWNQFSSLIRESAGKKLTLLIERGGKRIETSVTPVKDNGRYLIGVEPLMRLVFKKYGFFESLRLGFDKTIEFIDLTVITLKKLLAFNLSIKTLGGPVMIAQMSGQAAAAGLSAFLSLLAMVSISLGILNLLPIPVLDGGLILFLAIEAVRKKPLSRRTMEIAQSIGGAVLITLIAVVSYNDVMRMFFSK
jgi:regulator of sigma E protease